MSLILNFCRKFVNAYFRKESHYVLFCLYACICLCCNVGAVNLLDNVRIPAVIAFGDSYLDQGSNNNINTLIKANFPPYGKDFMGGIPTGRFTDGKSLADFFVKALEVKEYLPAYLDPLIQDKDLLTGVSFASGGAGYDPMTSTILSAIPLSVQLDMFKQYIEKLKNITGEEATNNIIPNSVFLVSASTNDFSSYSAIPIIRSLYDIPARSDMLVKHAVSFVQELYKLGARRIAILGAPPVGCLPAMRTSVGGPLRMCAKKENKAAELFNVILKQELKYLASSLIESRVAFVDFYYPLINILDNPHQYEVTDKGCCGTGEIEVIFLCNKLSQTCDDESKFLFWDSIHLSQEGCNIIVNQVIHELVKSLF
uniref:GDSL esterase/lipase EXL3-like isoform X2 n=1 Tax=Erigeron canadensis TaxID=72917 RepID=UPI001CB92B65|nr:GDSL esterase/lipase EXL3-like isoform X2 [Erigeron canadensis]